MAYIIVISFIVICYSLVLGFLYWNQERMIFHPTKLGDDYIYTFHQPFEELNFPVDGAVINAVHIKAENPKGVLLYLHGNGDIIARLDWIATFFVELGYDVVMPDYRSYGKSSGAITREKDLHADMEVVYQYLLQQYAEDEIVIYGQSIGTGMAATLAANHSPKQLILEAPYYNLPSVVRNHFPFVPGFLVKYQLRTNEQLPHVTCPVYLIHGQVDGLIPHNHSERLLPLIPTQKEFLSVPDANHGLLLGNEQVQVFLAERL